MPYALVNGKPVCYNDEPPEGATPCTQLEAKWALELYNEKLARIAERKAE